MHRAAPNKKSLTLLEKRVPRNPKYDNVKARIDSGLTMDKVHIVTTRQYLRRRSEPFARVTPRQLQELFAEYEEETDEEITGTRQACDGPHIITHEVEDRPRYEKPYLILDVRSPEEYQQCHIVQARNFPHQHLNQDKISADLLRYKNREGTLIILYDDEVWLSSATANQLIEKGWDNVYVLSGGLQGFAEDYSHLIEGQIARSSSEGGEEEKGANVSEYDDEKGDVLTPLCHESLSKLSLSSSSSAFRHSHQLQYRRPSAASSSPSECCSSQSMVCLTVSVPSKAASRLYAGSSARSSGMTGGRVGSTNGSSSSGMGSRSNLRSSFDKNLMNSSINAARRRAVDCESHHSRMSTRSVADSVILRAQAKKGSF